MRLILFLFLTISIRWTESIGICTKDESVQICKNIPSLTELSRIPPDNQGFSALVTLLICQSCNLTFTNSEVSRAFKGIQLFEAANSAINFVENVFHHNQHQIRLKSISFHNCTFKGKGVLGMFGSIPNLQEVSLDNTEIRTLGQELRGSYNLEYLRLDRVKMEHIESSALHDAPNLRILHLNYNKLEVKAIENQFIRLTNLEELSLRGNRINYVHTDYFPLNLKTLDISSNPILSINFHQFLWRGSTETIKMHEVPCSTLEALNKQYRFKKIENVSCRTRTFYSHMCNLLQVQGGRTKNIVIGETLVEKDDPSTWWLDSTEEIECINFPEIVARYEGVQAGLQQAAAEMLLYHTELLQNGIEYLDLRDGLSEVEYELIARVKEQSTLLGRYRMLIEHQITKF